VGTFRHPVGPLPGTVYWRRRLVLLGIPLFVIGLVAYACTGTTGTPTSAAGAIGGQAGAGPGAGPTGVITPAPGQTASGPPGAAYPGSGPTGSGTGTGPAGGASPGTGSGGSGGTEQAGLGGSGCALSLSLVLDRTSSSGPVQYPAGTYPTFKIEASDSGSANCTVDVSGHGLVVSVMPLGTTTPVWTSATCSGPADLRVLGPGDAQTYSVAWKRWEGRGETCPVSQLPTVAAGTYTVNAETDGVTTSQVEFVLD
jgi:hypothetical protein